MKPLITVAVILTFCAASCRKTTAHNTPDMPKREYNESRSAESIFISNSIPTPHHSKMESSEIGVTLDDAVRVLGQWDQVGDVMEDAEGQFYPFSNRSGYDYIVRVGKNKMITGVWRRQLKSESEQDVRGNADPATR